MSQMTPEVCRLLEKALSLSIEEQEALADSLISNLGGKVDEGVQAAWETEIGKRIADLDSGKTKDHPMVGSTPPQSFEAAPCAVTLSICMTKPRPNTKQRSIGMNPHF
jgi:hypothetical protein